MLTALQEDTLINILAALRFLVLFDVNKVRLQRLGTVPGLVALATQAARPALRSKAQSILGESALFQHGLVLQLQHAICRINLMSRRWHDTWLYTKLNWRKL